MDALNALNVTKSYNNLTALDDININITKGKIFGLLGPNGAGKTTFLRIVNKIIEADSGEIFFFGRKMTIDDVSKIGYLPEERGLFNKERIGDQAIYFAQLKGLSSEMARDRTNYWLKKLELYSWKDKMLNELSKGMQQKIQFLVTILHDPDLIILDEPFSGFDPINAELVKNEILLLKESGKTIILSTHNMDSVEKLCDDVCLIHKSKVILNNSLYEIKNAFKSEKYEIILKGGIENIQGTSFDKYLTIYDINNVDNQTQIKVKFHKESDINQALIEIMNKERIISFREILPTMHEIFINVINSEENDHRTS